MSGTQPRKTISYWRFLVRHGSYGPSSGSATIFIIFTHNDALTINTRRTAVKLAAHFPQYTNEQERVWDFKFILCLKSHLSRLNRLLSQDHFNIPLKRLRLRRAAVVSYRKIEHRCTLKLLGSNQTLRSVGDAAAKSSMASSRNIVVHTSTATHPTQKVKKKGGAMFES